MALKVTYQFLHSKRGEWVRTQRRWRCVEIDKQSYHFGNNSPKNIRCVNREGLAKGNSGKDGEGNESRLHCEEEKDEDVVGYYAQRGRNTVVNDGLFIFMFGPVYVSAKDFKSG